LKNDYILTPLAYKWLKKEERMGKENMSPIIQSLVHYTLSGRSDLDRQNERERERERERKRRS
jgi:hypothetical protein